MARTSNVFARVEPELKEQAEQVLSQRGIPFEMKLPKEPPLVYGKLTKAQLDAALEEGMEDIRAGRTYDAQEVLDELRRDYGL